MTTRSRTMPSMRTLPIPADKLQWMQEQLIKAGKLKEPISTQVVTAPEYREKALKLVGKLMKRA